jgi:hypothetical protein
MQPSEYGLGIQWVGNPNAYGPGAKTSVTVHWAVAASLAGIDATFAVTGNVAHYAVGDDGIHQYVAEGNGAPHCGNTDGNTHSIGVEHVGGYMGPNGVRVPPSDATLRRSGLLIGRLHHEWGMGRPVWGTTMRPHNSWSSTECPGTTDVAALTSYAQAEYDRIAAGGGVPNLPGGGSTGGSAGGGSAGGGSTGGSYDVFYNVRTQASDWLGEVKNLEDYAGWNDSPITDVMMRVNQGSIKYRVHLLGGGWLPWVTGYNGNDDNNGYAGMGGVQPIDAIQAYLFSPNGNKVIAYKVAPCGGTGFWPWQRDDETTGGQDGYAGIFGRLIGKLQAQVIDWSATPTGGGAEGSASGPAPTGPRAMYQVYGNIWYESVYADTNLEVYAGVNNVPIKAFRFLRPLGVGNTNIDCMYRVQPVAGSWYPYIWSNRVGNYSDDNNYGYAGDMTHSIANIAVVMKNNNLQMRVRRLNGLWSGWINAFQVADVGHGCVWKLESTGTNTASPVTCVQFQPKPGTSA